MSATTTMNPRMATVWLVATAVVAAVLFEPLFTDASMLSLDNRVAPPWVSLAGESPTPRLMNVIGSDINGWIAPATILAVRSLQHGALPLWNAKVGLGQPLLAELAIPAPQFTLLFAVVVDPVRALVLVTALHFIVAGVGAFCYLRGHGCGLVASTLGAVAAMWSGFNAAHLHLPQLLFTVAYFPWLLVTFEALGKLPSVRTVAWAALVAGLSLLAGFPQVAFLQIGVAIVAQLVVARKHWQRWPAHLLATTVSLGLAGALAAIALLPGSELLAHSLRREGLTGTQMRASALEPELLAGFVLPHLFHDPVHAIDLTAPNPIALAPLPTEQRWLEHADGKLDVQNNFTENTVYVGLLVLPLAVLGAFRRRSTALLAIVAVGGVLVATGAPLVIDLIRLAPAFATGNPKRALALTSTSAALLAGCGLDVLVRDRTPWHRALLATTGALYVAIVIGGLAVSRTFGDAGVRLRAAIAPDVVVLGAAALTLLAVAWSMAPARPKPARAAAVLVLVCFTGIELASFLRRTNPWQGLDGQYASTPAITFLREQMGDAYRMARIGRTTALAPNLAATHGLASIDGAGAMLSERTAALLRCIDPAIVDLENPRILHGLPSAAALQLPLLDALSVSHVVTTTELPASAHCDLVYASPAERLGIYARRHPLPIVRLARDYRVIEDATLRLAELRSPGFDPRTAVLETEIAGIGRELGQGSCLGERPAAGEIAASVDVTAPALLVVAESWLPGWRARIDGNEVGVIRANHALMAVAVPAGTHTVRLSYWPRSFALGAALSAAALVLLSLALLAPRQISTTSSARGSFD